jgi:disulfide bond formation protein DsbB
MFKAERALEMPAYRLAGVALLISIGVIVTALAFEYIGRYTPCPLCLMQRWAYYAAIPALFLGMALTGERPRIAGLIFLAVALAFLANAGLAAYHAGVEWKFWAGPDTCATAGSTPTSASDLLEGLNDRVVRCDEAAWRLFGLSFAGWNVVACLMLMTLALKAAFATIDDK